MFPRLSALLSVMCFSVLFCGLVAQPAFAHTHTWNTGTPPEGLTTPTLQTQPDADLDESVAEPRAIRVGSIVRLVPYFSLNDPDLCANTDGSCTFTNAIANNVARAIKWTDNGKGGIFGKKVCNTGGCSLSPLNANDPTQASQITHYKAPSLPGTVNLQVTIDDIPTATDSKGVSFTTYDDPQATSLPYPITVWDFTISKVDPGFFPKVDGQEGSGQSRVALGLQFKPATDYEGTPIPFSMSAELHSSSQPGYCMNASFGTDNDARDFQFRTEHQDSGYPMTVTNWMTINFTRDQLKQWPAGIGRYTLITITSYDDGGFGSVTGSITLYNNSFASHPSRLVGAPLTVERLLNTDSFVPKDANSNGIADDATDTVNYDPGGSIFNQATDDSDSIPTGDTTPGDGLSRYDEYRGFLIQGQYKRLNITKKDVFLVNQTGIQNRYFTDTQFGLQGSDGIVHELRSFSRLSKAEYGAAYMTINFCPFHLQEEIIEQSIVNPNLTICSKGKGCSISKQTAILVENAVLPDLTLWTTPGRTYPNTGASDPQTPDTRIHCYVFKDEIYGKSTQVPRLLNPMDEYSTSFSIPEELGGFYLNGVQLRDHGLPLSGWVKIGEANACQEVMSYNSVSFTNDIATFYVDRSTNNMKCNHPLNAPVSWYVDPEDVSARTLAHEATHLLNIKQHTLDFWEVNGRHTIMNASLPGGSIGINFNNSSLPSYWNDFSDTGGNVLDHLFRVKAKP